MIRFSAALFSVLFLTAAVAGQGIGSDTRVHLRFAQFDPLVAPVTPAALPQSLRGGQDTRLWIVQFDGLPTQERRVAVRAQGAQIHGYLPENAYVVRMRHSVQQRVAKLRGVRSVTYYHPAFRVDPTLIARIESAGRIGPDRGVAGARTYNVVVVDKRNDKDDLVAAIERIGGVVRDVKAGSLLLEADLTATQLAAAARLDQVLWIDAKTSIGVDMDNARTQSGANRVETVGAYTGKGIRGHVFEGLELTHPDFANRPTNVLSGGQAAAHGHCVAGIVFGSGKSTAAARGMAPDATPFYSTHTSLTGSRAAVVADLVGKHQVMFTTASWGHALTSQYTSISAEADDIVFDHDIPWTQSQANSSSTMSRPEAWAKNVVSVGGVAHRGNSNPADDSWRAGGGSTGPAADGRMKPDLVAFEDGITCSDLVGAAGFNRAGNFYTNFGGTSGATAIVAGTNALALQMFTDGLFSPKRKANGTRWENRPHFTTLKALQIANAAQYSFQKTSRDNRREHVGWGFPSLATMHANRKLHFVVDETDILQQGDGMSYKVRVAKGQSELKVSLCWADPAANPSAARTRVNDLSLRVISPKGAEYWGNAGLGEGNYSKLGGTRDLIDTVENVFIKDPEVGEWEIEVGAFAVVEDSHVETQAVDIDFGLVSVGGTFVSKKKVDVPVGAFFTFGGGCPAGPGCVPIFNRNWTQTIASYTTTATKVGLMDWTSAATTICSIDVHAGAKSGTVDANVAIYSMNQTTGLPDKVLTSERVRFGKLKTYVIPFRTPVTLTSADLFFVVLDQADKLVLPVSKSGEARLHHDFRSNKWDTTPQFKVKWSYRIHGITGKPVPKFEGAGSPYIGKTFHFDLSNVKPSSVGVMFLGFSDKQWGAIKLPVPYFFPCNLLVSGEIQFPFTANAVGEARISLPIPNDNKFVSLTTYQQFLVIDSQNPVGFIVSNGGRLKIGK